MNPLKYDPTQTGHIRRKYQADMRRRFVSLRKALWRFLVVDDSLQLKPVVNPLTGNAVPIQYDFPTSVEKVKYFKEWLQDQVDTGILSVDGPGPAWQNEYVDSSYRQGFYNGYDNVNRDLGDDLFKAGQRQTFVESAFLQPEQLSKVELIYARNYELLSNVTSTMSTQISQTLATGIAGGKNPRTIAREMSKQIEGITNKRALLIARTEVIHAHAEGTLDSYDSLGVTDVKADVEFSTAGDDRVCPICSAMNGQVYTVAEARGVIPVHPNCRCSWLPATTGIDAGSPLAKYL